MATIFEQYLQPVRSIQDRMADLDAQDYRREQLAGAKQQNQLQALAMQRDAQTRAEAEQDKSLLQQYAGQAGGDQNAFIKMLRGSGRMALMTQGDAIEKALLERQKSEAQTGEAKAKTEKAKVDADKERLGMQLKLADLTLQATSAAKDDPSYQQALQWLSTQGVDISKLPQRYDPQYVAAQGQIAMTARERADQEWKAKNYGLEERKFDQSARNDLVLPNGAINQPILAAKSQIANAGKASISINTGQKGLDNEFKLRGEFKQEPVYKAHQEMQAAHGQIKQAIAQASPAGDLAAATKIMKLLDPGSVVRESELGMAMQASGLMDRVLNYGNMVVTGQKLTPTQRKDFQSLADRLYGESVNAFNSKRTEYERLGSEYGLNAPRALGPAVSGGPNATPPAKPGGTVLRFDANGKPVTN